MTVEIKREHATVQRKATDKYAPASRWTLLHASRAHFDRRRQRVEAQVRQRAHVQVAGDPLVADLPQRTVAALRVAQRVADRAQLGEPQVRLVDRQVERLPDGEAVRREHRHAVHRVGVERVARVAEDVVVGGDDVRREGEHALGDGGVVDVADFRSLSFGAERERHQRGVHARRDVAYLPVVAPRLRCRAALEGLASRANIRLLNRRRSHGTMCTRR